MTRVTHGPRRAAVGRVGNTESSLTRSMAVGQPADPATPAGFVSQILVRLVRKAHLTIIVT